MKVTTGIVIGGIFGAMTGLMIMSIYIACKKCGNHHDWDKRCNETSVSAVPSNDRPCETQLFEGDGLKILPESKEFRFKCCKCALIHRIEIEHADEGVILRFYEEAES